jgi:hypothetical protein
MMLRRRVYLLIICLAALCVSVAPARADLYGFGAITNNSGVSGTYAGQLAVDVTAVGSSQVSFTFYNDGPYLSPYDVVSPIAGAITEIYFDDGALLGSPTITNMSGVNFVNGADPGNLPSGHALDLDFIATVAFSAESDPEKPVNGVNPNEYVSLLFGLEQGKTFADVLSAIDLGFNQPEVEGALRIGIHVRGILPEGVNQSDSFIMTPAPAAVILGMLGLGAAGMKLRKFV